MICFVLNLKVVILALRKMKPRKHLIFQTFDFGLNVEHGHEIHFYTPYSLLGKNISWDFTLSTDGICNLNIISVS